MKNKQFPSNKKLLSIQEEKTILEFDYDTLTGTYSCGPKKRLLLEIQQKSPNLRKSTRKVLVSIKPRTTPIKTLYTAEESKRSSGKSQPRIGIGDHSYFTTDFSDSIDTENSLTYDSWPQKRVRSDLDVNILNSSRSEYCISNTSISSDRTSRDLNEDHPNEFEVDCYESSQPNLAMINDTKVIKTERAKNSPRKVDIATLVVNNTRSIDTLSTFFNAINILNIRIDSLERKIIKREMEFHSNDHNSHLTSSDEEVKDSEMNTIGRPGCSYIEQYSHIPETSAFQRHPHQGSSLSPRQAITLEKEHNSEQYGRDFTTYDGITARGRRQCASVPCKRDNVPKVAAERVHKIRHKLNPVRDYRLMDTVHYLAQGEFAPRDDGIKLTPSREAVLSDIIWEDVCRTHWPNTRLSRRAAHSERYSTRGELQRLIDNLLRERVAHVERRKRRHYRIVKMNNRQENCRPVGKTGDIIVASNKNKQDSNGDLVINDHKATSAVMTERRRGERCSRKNHKSHERVIVPRLQPTSQLSREQCFPGTSYAAYSASNKKPTNCFQTSTSKEVSSTVSRSPGGNNTQEFTSSSSISIQKTSRKPRLVVKKDGSRRKNVTREELNLEHFILLPTLVVRTPSNMKRQKKFNELYHRILNVHINEANLNSANLEVPDVVSNSTPFKKDIGFNINITLSDSEEMISANKIN